MGRMILILTILFVVKIPIHAQTRWTYSYTDSLTYSLFIAGKYQNTIDSSSAAIKAGTDFYYLRMRRGISFYQLQEFGNAIPEFEHAQEFFPADTVSREYIYLSEMEMGRRNEARMDGKKMSDTEKKSVQFKNPIVTQIGGWVGGSVFNTSALDPTQEAGPGTIQATVYKNLFFGDFYLKNRICQRFELTSEFFYLKFSQLEQFPPPPPPPHNGPPPRPQNPTQFISAGTQPGILVDGKYLCSRKFSVDGSFFLANTNSTTHKLIPPYEFQIVQHQINSFEYGIGATYHFAHADVCARGYYLQAADTGNIFQASLLSTFYPKANLDFYIKTNLSGVIINNGIHPDLSLLIGKKIAQHAWLDGEFLYGNLRYYTAPENNLLYNMADQTSWRFSAALHLFFINHLQIDFQYAYTSRFSDSRIFSPVVISDYTFNYNSNQLTISTTWKF